jgi:hypothetical protein
MGVFPPPQGGGDGMRGKLRDKSALSRRDTLRRPEGEQYQPYKRATRGTQWIGQPLEEDDEEYDVEEELELDEAEELEREDDPVRIKEPQKK